MPMTFRSRAKGAWNAFFNKDPTTGISGKKRVLLAEPSYTASPLNYLGPADYTRPDQIRFRPANAMSIINGIFTRIAIDVAAVKVAHCRIDNEGHFEDYVDSDLNDCLRLDANMDQTGRDLIQDAVLTMLDDGVVAICPIDTTKDPTGQSEEFDIQTLRNGRVHAWFPSYIQVEAYNEVTGKREEMIVPKTAVAIVNNPLYSVMNEYLSMAKRLITKLNTLDTIDEKNASGKLDIIVQLPYTIKGEGKKQQAEERRKDIEMQLVGSKYGIAYIDAAERITQLNRPAENNIMSQVEYYTSMLMSQLGMTEAVFNGTASEQEMLNYYNRTIQPILAALCDEMTRKFLSKTARTQHQAVSYFRDPFSLTPVNQIAEMADKFTRNEILSPNEFRGIIGYKPVDDDRADELRNRNLNENTDTPQAPVVTNDEEDTNENPSVEKSEPEGLSDEEIKDLLAALTEGKSMKGE